MTDNNKSSELFLARDIIDTANEYSDDSDALEYLCSFAFNIVELRGNDTVDWWSIFSILDQAYLQKNIEALRLLAPIYDKVVAHIKAQ